MTENWKDGAAAWRMPKVEVDQRRDRQLLQSIWVEEIIEIAGFGGLSKVYAKTFGPFAVHLNQNDRSLDVERFTITHLYTGRAVARAVDSEKAAQEMAEQLMTIADWWSELPADQQGSSVMRLQKDARKIMCDVANRYGCDVFFLA